MLVKLVILVLVLAILGSLGSGLFYMIRGKAGDRRTVKALTLRIALSLALFFLLLLAYAFGLIQPHGVIPPQP